MKPFHRTTFHSQASMRSFWRSLYLVYAKDLKSEWRKPFSFFSSLLFASVLAMIYSYSLEAEVFQKAQNFQGMLLASLFFSSTLSALASSRSEIEGGALGVINMSFLDPLGIYFAKLLLHWHKQLLFILLCVPIYSLFLQSGSLDLKNEAPLSLFLCLAFSALSLSSLASLMPYLSLGMTQKAELNALLLLPAAVPVLLFAMNFLAEGSRDSSSSLEIRDCLLLLAPAGIYAGLGSLAFSQLCFEELESGS